MHGVVFTVTRSDGSTAATRIHVSLDYSSFADAFGGDYATRLRLVELPACALTTPGVADCRRQMPVTGGSADNVRDDHVGADVSLPGASTAAALPGGAAGRTILTSAEASSAGTAEAVVLAVTPVPSGSGGNYAELPLSEEDEWVNGGSSGTYTYSYPIQVPSVPGDLAPAVALSYNSQATDGLASSTNNETSWIGEGWDYSPDIFRLSTSHARLPAALS